MSFTMAAISIVLFSCGIESPDTQSEKTQFYYEPIERVVDQALSMGPRWNRTPAPIVSYTASPDLPTGFALNASTGEISGNPSSPIFTAHTITATIEEGVAKQATVSILIKEQPSDKAALLAVLKAEIEKQGLDADLRTIDTGRINNMDNLFNPAKNPFTKNFNGNPSKWDVSNVTSMNGIFLGAAAFNQDLGSWDVSNVTSMNQMFWQASAFNQDLGSWKVNKATDMNGMFAGASAFNQDIGSWPVGKIQDMSYMFYGASAFNQNLEAWAVASGVGKNYMFKNSGMEGNPPSWYP